MVLAYLDIETYSPEKEPRFEDRVILIGLKIKKDVMLLKEWESSEKNILSQFYNFLKDRVEKETVTLIGWNLVRFDIPFLTYRIWKRNIDSLVNIFEVFRKTYWRDLRQCLLPFNEYRFRGLSEDEIAKKFGIKPPTYSNKEISYFYKNRMFGKIEEHIISEFKFLSDLSWKMRDIREVMRVFESGEKTGT